MKLRPTGIARNQPAERVLAARLADRPERLARFGVAAGVVAPGAAVVSVGAGVAARGVVLTRGVGAVAGAVGAVVAAATGAALLARSPGV